MWALEFKRSQTSWERFLKWVTMEYFLERVKWPCRDCRIIVYRVERNSVVILGIYHGAQLRPGHES